MEARRGNLMTTTITVRPLSIESSERRDELFPVLGDPTGSEEWQQWVAANTVWQTLMGFFDDSWIGEFTDYHEVG